METHRDSTSGTSHSSLGTHDTDNIDGTRGVPDMHGVPAHLLAVDDTLLLTLDEAARELRCARRSLERYIDRHELQPVRFGRCVRIERAELKRFIAQRRGSADAATA